jgi:hypothetical protein
MTETGLGDCPPNYVDQFKKVSKIFLIEFLAFQTWKRPFGYLLRLHQHSNETFKEFVTRFYREKITIENPIEDMVYATLYQGISPEEPLMRKLARKQPITMQGLVDKEE